MPQKLITPWQVLESREIFTAPPWIKLYRQRIRLPDGRVVEDFHLVDFTDYAVVVAETVEGKFIIERQYKHGIGKVSLLFPAGGIARGEDPQVAAQRELLEETGYAAEQWRCLGHFVCNANYGCGSAHIFTARNARQIAQPNSGDLEQMEIMFLTACDVLLAVREGRMSALAGTTAALLALATDTAHP